MKILADFARSNVLLAFDYDGTLAPIVEHPRDAVMRPETRALLWSVAQLYPCAVISGRSRADVRHRLTGTGIRAVVGNHGADLTDSSGVEERMAEWASRLERDLGALEGVWVENKGLSLAVHYRNSPRKREARRLIVKSAEGLACARLTPAKQSLNVLWPLAPNKGGAVEVQVQKMGCDCVIFIGDDDTDEDVFTRDWSGALFGITVGSRKSAADCRLRSQLEIDRLLRTLIDLRDPASAAKRA